MSILVTEAGLPLLAPDDVDPFLAFLDAEIAADIVDDDDVNDADVVAVDVLNRVNDDDDDEPRLSSRPIPPPRILGATMSL